MCSYELRYTKKSQRQLRQLKSIPENKREKVLALLVKLSFDPTFRAIGSKPVPMIGASCYSKDIGRGDRVVYMVIGAKKIVVVLSLFGHYCDNGGKNICRPKHQNNLRLGCRLGLRGFCICI